MLTPLPDLSYFNIYSTILQQPAVSPLCSIGQKRGNQGGGDGGGKKMRADSITLRFLLQSKVSLAL